MIFLSVLPAQTPRRASGRKSLLPNTFTANVAVALRGQQPAAGASRPRVRNAGFGAALGRRMESLRGSPRSPQVNAAYSGG